MFKTRICFILFLVTACRFSYAQLNRVTDGPIDEGVTVVAKFLNNNIKPEVRLFGIGDFQFMIKEPAKLNYAITAYLISGKKVNTVCLPIPDWELRGMNEYIQDNNNFSNRNFDSIFHSIFAGSEYNHQPLKDLFLWIKKYNTTNVQNPVSLRGVEYLGLETAKFPKMNDYLIETYIRPYSQAIADSMKAAWERNGNSNSVKSDSVILALLRSYISVAEKTNALPEQELEQLKFYFDQRRWMYGLISSTLKENDKIFNLVQKKATVEAELIDSLLKNKKNKLAFLSTDANVMNVYVNAVNKLNNQSLSIPTNGPKYKEKYKDEYFCTVTSFADSANVIGVKGSLRYQPILIFGDEQVKALRKKQEVFFYSKNESELKDLKIPIINSGGWGGEEVELITKKAENDEPYDVLFIFKNLSRIEFLK